MAMGSDRPPNYICIFEGTQPGWRLMGPDRVEFYAADDAAAYRHVIDHILGKERGAEALTTLRLERLLANGKPCEMMRWRRGPGWEFVDDRPSAVIEDHPPRTPWYSDRR